MIFAIFTVLTVLFFGIRIGGGDPTAAIQGSYATPESIESLRISLGLDKPILEQYLIYIKSLIKGDLGVSLLNGQPAIDQIIEVVPHTLDLTILGLIIGVIFGMPLGFIAAKFRNKAIDHVIRIISLSGISIPAFMMGYFLIIVFVLVLDLFPVTGSGNLNDPIDRAYKLFLPALSLGLVMTAYITRMTRTTVIEILEKDFIRTARAKGVNENTILIKHVLRLSLVTIVTLIGLYATITIGSSVVIETVFSRTGVGRLIVGAVAQRDYVIVQAAIIFYATFVGLVNLLIDLTYTFIDPRIKFYKFS